MGQNAFAKCALKRHYPNKQAAVAAARRTMRDDGRRGFDDQWTNVYPCPHGMWVVGRREWRR